MVLDIVHETLYRYTTPVRHSIQMLRLTPRPDPLQRVRRWRIAAPKRLWAGDDAYGNHCHTLVVAESHHEIRVVVEGTIEITAPAQPGVLPVAPERLSPMAYLTGTALTAPAAAVRAFADAHFPSSVSAPADLLGLAQAIAGTVSYRSGITESHTSAAEALDHGYGVCQDHAHLFIACCRYKGMPARYVSGYVEVGDVEHAASHAWVQAWLPAVGWVSLDVTHTCLVTDRHCSLAVGRDFDSASPIRGVRTGGGGETLAVNVAVSVGQQ